MLEKTLESPLDCKEIKLINPKGNQSLKLIERTDAEAPRHRPPDEKNQLIWKKPWYWERLKTKENGAREDEMVGWHHWLNGHEFGQALGDSGGQRSLVCYSLLGCKESDTAWQLNNNKFPLQANKIQKIRIFEWILSS